MDFSKEDAKWAKKTSKCRNIVKDILDSGIDNFQKLKIIELLALELDDREQMLNFVDLSRKFLEGLEEKSAENNKRRIEI